MYVSRIVSNQKKALCLMAAFVNFPFAPSAFAQMAEGPQWTKNDDKEIFRAFDDELKRTVGKLKLGEHPAPYFVSIYGSDSKYISVYGAFGALDRISDGRGRNLDVEVRVGDYKFDNTGAGNSFFYSPYSAYSSETGLSLEDDYDSIRRALWLLCDGRYKRAIEDLEKKKAVLHQKKIDNLPDSFSKTEPVVSIMPLSAQPIDLKRWGETVRRVSKEFRANPGIVDCRVQYENLDHKSWYQNSEGSKYRRQEFASMLNLSATAQAPDGMFVTDFAYYAVRKDKDLPNEEELLARARSLSLSAVMLAQAPLIEEYSGPILFEKQAAAEFFCQTIVPQLVVPTESSFERRNKRAEADLLGKRILPKFINISDDPLAETFQGKPLKGGYLIDDESVRAKPITLVEHGMLKTLCSGRTPTRGISESNGHFRVDKAKVSQLFITADTTKTEKELRDQLIQMGKDAGLSHVMIARKILDHGTSTFDMETSFTDFLSPSRKAIELAPPTLLYKVSVADGSEQLVRGARFAGLTRRTWRDIESAGNDSDVYTTSQGFSAVGNTFSVVCPSILVSEVDIVRNSNETDLPIALERPDLATKPAVLQNSAKDKGQRE